ncbi:hypothetical protein J6590_010685 [Homalodisca vitripennis]|nr:hypothetical protein J6590_010685 [Homalodisca vitripennis]
MPRIVPWCNGGDSERCMPGDLDLTLSLRRQGYGELRKSLPQIRSHFSVFISLYSIVMNVISRFKRCTGDYTLTQKSFGMISAHFKVSVSKRKY